MKHTLLKTNCSLAVTLATFLFVPTLSRADTVIDHIPYTITAPGEYVLQSNITVRESVGITVTADNVVINLNGFTLTKLRQGPEDGIVVDGNNVTVRNGTIDGFFRGVFVTGSQATVRDLELRRNEGVGVYLSGGDDNTVTNCFIVGDGGSAGIGIGSSNGDLLKNNQICECENAVVSNSEKGCAILHNYVANSLQGLLLGDHDCYQGNVVTNCKTAFNGGHAVGGENGSD